MDQPDYTKLDGALVSALDDRQAVPERLSVFLQLEDVLTDAARQKLTEFHVPIPKRPTRTLTAQITRGQIGWLSHQSWIRAITLSTHLKPLDD